MVRSNHPFLLPYNISLKHIYGAGAAGASFTIAGQTFGVGTLTPLFRPLIKLSAPK